MSGIQMMLPVILTEGVKKRDLALSHVVKLMSANPARILGLYPRIGSILPRADTDFVIVDLEKEWVFEREHILSENQHSLYLGRRFQGRVEQTIVCGQVVYSEGVITASPSWGYLVKRCELSGTGKNVTGSDP